MSREDRKGHVFKSGLTHGEEVFNGKEEEAIHAGIRDSAVKLITEQGYQIGDAGRNLVFTTTMFGRLKRAIESVGCTNPDLLGGRDLQTELTRLRKENRRLLMERKILKKAAVFANKSGNGINDRYRKEGVPNIPVV